MTRSSNKGLVTPYEEPKRVLHSTRKLFKTTSLDYSSSSEFDLFSNNEDQFEEEVTETMREPTMEEYITKIREDYGSRITRPKFNEKARFELKGHFFKELRDNAFSGTTGEDEVEHIEKFSKIVNSLDIPNITVEQLMHRIFHISLTRAEVILFYKGLDVPTRQILDSKGVMPKMNDADAKKAIQEMADHSQKWQWNKVNEKVCAAQVGCELCNGSHYSKDCPLNEKGKTLEEAYYTQFGLSFPQGGRNRASTPGFYQRDNGNPPYQDRLIDDSYEEKEVLGELIEGKESATNLKRLIKERQRVDCQIKASINVQDSAILKDSLPSKEKDLWSLRELAPTKLIIESVDRTIKRSKGIAENILVGIDKFVFPVDFIVLDMHEDIKVSLILGRPFLSTTHVKIDVFKRKITLRVGDDKIVFKSDNPTSNIIKRVYVLGLRERMELDLEARLMREAFILNRSLDLVYEDYIELNDLNEPWELRLNQEVNNLGPTVVEGEVIDKPIDDIVRTRNDDEEIKGIDEYPSFCDFDRKIHIDCAYNLQFSCMIVVENMDAYRDQDMGKVIVGKPFCKEVSTHDELNRLLHPYQKLKSFYKGVLNLGPKYIRDAKTVE
ncbi:putative reverse transcriptase domain-containing protein [Tanacetum coccineum]